MDEQAFLNQQMRGNVQYNVNQTHQMQQSHEQQLYQQQHQQGRQPIYHQQNVNYQKGYDGGSQYNHGNEQQSLYNQQSYQMGYNQQQAVSTQYYTIPDDDDSIIVAENCVVMTSDPSPEQLMAPQSSIGAHYPPEQQQTSRYPYLPSISDGVPSSTFYGQARQQQQQHREPHYVVVDPLTYSAGFQQIHSQQSTQKQPPQRQILRSSLPIQQVQRRAAPFEEEEEEMEGSDEDDEWQQDELVQTTSQQRYKININEPRMTRAARRKQNFEGKSKPEKQKKVDIPKKMCSDIFSDEVEKNENSVQKYEKKTISGTWAAVSPKKEILAEKPLFDKNIAHIQAVQRLSTAEGWRRMNEWLKSSIKTMDLPKLRQLLAQLVDADITVELLRDNDTPKIVKDLQKCADKEIANFASKMVTKWKQTIRDGNKEKQLKLQQQQHQETKVKAQKPSGVGVAAVSGKNVKRASTESDVGDGPSTSQTSGQLKPRTGSISSAASHQQQIGSRSNSFNVQNTTGLNKTGESSVSAPPKPERPKTIAKAKAKISRPRLTGLEGDESATTVNKSVERSIGTNKTKTSTTVSSKAATSTTAASAHESPLARIMAATAKFHAEQQPKRKSVEVVFSDNFMDSLSAADVAKPKKAKIVRKKLSEQKDDSTKSDVRESYAPVDEYENNPEGSLAKKRVRFFDEIGRDLVDVRFFEVEEGERINVSKMGGMDKEAIKHLDSQREKQFLLDARRHGFGSTTPTSSGGYSSVLMDPSLMPPGHGRMFGDQTRPGVTSNSFKVPETRYPWRLLPVECQTIINIEPGCRSEAKGIEYERQRTILPALVLPTALPVSDIDANELKQQREEGMMQMPKIIPLELVTEGPQKLTIEENNEEEESEIKLETLKIDLSPKKKLGMEEREEMFVDETESKLEDYEVYENEALRSPSPERPPVCQIPSSDEDSRDDIKELKDSIKENDQLDSQDNDGGIASPEPEQLNESFTDSGSSSIKEIPTEQLPSSRDLDDEDDKEDLDIRDQQQKLQKHPQSATIPSSTSTSLSSTPTLSSSNLQAFKKIPNLNSLLQKISTFVGGEFTTTGTSSTTLTSSITSSAIVPKGPNDPPLGRSIAETSNVLASDKVQGNASEKQLQQPKTSSIPPPPAPLYPPLGLPIHPLPASTFQPTFLPVRMTMPNTAIPPFQQINNTTVFPPSDFSVPPPPIPGVRYGFTSGQRMPVDAIQQQNSTQTNVSTTIEKQDEKSPETAEGQRRQISPGPPGLDEGGSPPPSLEQQQQKSPSSVQIPQSIQQFSSVSPSIMINQQQPKLPPRQISLEEAKEIAGSCQFYKRTGTCNFGERCKFAHDDEHLTFGVQMAMRGVSMPNRGGFRGSRGGSNSVGRAGGARDSPKVDAEGGSGRFEKRTSSRRTAGSDSTSRRLDYDISPVRGGGSEDTVKGNRDRRYRRSSPQRRRGHSRSRSRDRYSRRRRSSSRSRNGRRRAKSSSSSSCSRSATSVSRSSTPQKDRDRKRSRSRTPTRRRRDYSRQRYRRDYYRRRSPPRRRFHPLQIDGEGVHLLPLHQHHKKKRGIAKLRIRVTQTVEVQF